MRVRFRTNLDEYKHEEWPETLPVVPVKGQRVQARSGRQLHVVSTCWLYDGTLEVELHKMPAGEWA